LLGTSLTLLSVVEFGARTDDGQIIQAVTLPWFDIVRALQKDREVAFQLTPQQWEELIAGAYERAGFDQVILTPRSGDRGRDVIAIKHGVGTIRVIDQVKAYKPGRLVTANDVRALFGVVVMDRASKGFLSTTSDFAPRLRQDPLIACLADFVTTTLDEAPERFAEGGIECLDVQHNVQILGSPELEARGFHSERRGRAANQHELIGVFRKVLPKYIDASYHGCCSSSSASPD